MINLVIIDGQKYLVDVGFGSDGLSGPAPLQDGVLAAQLLPGLQARLEYKNLPKQHTDPDQRVWVYAASDGKGGFKDKYCFTEVEFFPGDYVISNYMTMTNPKAFFVQAVVAVRAVLGDDGAIAGVRILFKDSVRLKLAGTEVRDSEHFDDEKQRVAALKKYFDISLSAKEQEAIAGLATQLRSHSEV